MSGVAGGARCRINKPTQSENTMIQIDINELRKLLCGQSAEPAQADTSGFWVTGKKYFIRTVTHHHTGVLVSVSAQEITLEQAAWIADDGRLTDALRTGVFNEVEMFPTGKVLVGRSAIIDAVQIVDIPTSQK